MNNEKHNDQDELEIIAEQVPEHRVAELRDLEERLKELCAQGILSGGDGPRETLRPIAYVPGATKRLIERRG